MDREKALRAVRAELFRKIERSQKIMDIAIRVAFIAALAAVTGFAGMLVTV